MYGTDSLADREMGRAFPANGRRCFLLIPANDWMKYSATSLPKRFREFARAYHLIEESVNVSQPTGSRREAESALRSVRGSQRR